MAADVPAAAGRKGIAAALRFSVFRRFTMKGSLYHKTPGWVPFGSPFHVRLRVDRVTPSLLTDPVLAPHVIASACRYHAESRWHLTLMVMMPDHIHMIVSFPGEPGMSRTIANWKAYLARAHGIKWQGNYFDHRLRNNAECVEKAHYIRMNPVRACYCKSMDDWKWVLDSSRLDQVAADVPAAAGCKGA